MEYSLAWEATFELRSVAAMNLKVESPVSMALCFIFRVEWFGTPFDKIGKENHHAVVSLTWL